MNKVYLISEAYLKSNTLIDDNVDNYILIPAVEYSQDIRLVELIGEYNVNELKEYVRLKLEDDFLKLALEEYVIPFLAAQVVAEIQVPLQYKIKNAGIITNTPERVQTTSTKDIQYLTDYYESIANNYGEKLVSFYKANSKIVDEKNIYPSNIYTPNSISMDCNSKLPNSPMGVDGKIREKIEEHNQDKLSHPYLLEEIKKIDERTGVEEAPVNGLSYVRNSKSWIELNAGIEDAPADGNDYVRNTNNWVEFNGVTEGVLNLALTELLNDEIIPTQEKVQTNTNNISTLSSDIQTIDDNLDNLSNDVGDLTTTKLDKTEAESLYVSKTGYIPYTQSDKTKVDNITIDISTAKSEAISSSNSYTDEKIGDIDTVLDYIITQQNTI